MRALFALICAFLLFANPASAGLKQAGIVCNHVEAASAAAFFLFVGDRDDLKEIAWLVSTPTKWCIPGFVRFSRPNSSKIGLEHVQSDLDTRYAEVQFFGDIVMAAPTISIIMPVTTIFGTLIKMTPKTTVDLREFRRENGRKGYFINVIEKIPTEVFEKMRRDTEEAKERIKALGFH